MSASVQDLIRYAPHRPPMLWVDEVVSYGATAGECAVVVKSDAHYMDAQGLRASSCLEFIAQSYGYMSICYRVNTPGTNSNPLKRAFLASIKDARFAPLSEMRAVRAGDRLSVHIRGVRHMGPITLFSGEVRNGDTTLCSCQMKVFSEQ